MKLFLLIACCVNLAFNVIEQTVAVYAKDAERETRWQLRAIQSLGMAILLLLIYGQM